jgi:hypothetical protein
MMTDGDADGLLLEDGDRLPWLEPAGVVDEDNSAPVGKIVGLVIAGLALLGVIVGGSYWLKHSGVTEPGAAKLIAAQGGDYKIPANDSDGKAFKGTGDTSYATSEGVDTDGRVDASRMPETPMADISRGSITRDNGKSTDSKPSAKVSAAVKDETKAAAVATPAAKSVSGGAMIQVGAYGSEAIARDAWKKLSRRFDYLAVLGNVVEKAEVGGSTVYRLRASAGSAADASTLCGRLKVAGENCIVVK